MPLIRCTNTFFQGGYPVTLLPPPRRLVPSLGLGTTWVRQPRSGSCHYPTAATKCNKQPSQATANPVCGKACSSTKGGFLRYIDSQSLQFEICILQALNMSLILCTNVFSQGGYPVTTAVVLSTSSTHPPTPPPMVGLLAGICWTKSQSPRYSPGLWGGTND